MPTADLSAPKGNPPHGRNNLLKLIIGPLRIDMHTQHITLPANAHILVVKLAGIGDLLLATPALRALRETYPQAHIDLLVTPDRLVCSMAGTSSIA